MICEAFAFLEPGPLIDAELQLVEPAEQWVDDHLRSCHDPRTMHEMPRQAHVTREELLSFVRRHPRGLTQGDSIGEVSPGYQFWLRLRPSAHHTPLLPMAGAIGLRIGHTPNLELYLGHIGYHVFPAVRGHHYAERACRLLLPLARRHGLASVIITCNPDNPASRRTCERLGGQLLDIVPVPRENALYGQGDREKCRFRIQT